MNENAVITIPAVVARAEVIRRSYEGLFGQRLVAGAGLEAAERIFHAPFVVVAHDTQADPLFDFGNATALSLWEMSWDEFVGLPSRYSAEEAHREERDRMLREVSELGYSRSYSGIRTSKNGRRFRIEDATVFNLTDGENCPRGQAAVFSRWTYL